MGCDDCSACDVPTDCYVMVGGGGCGPHRPHRVRSVMVCGDARANRDDPILCDPTACGPMVRDDVKACGDTTADNDVLACDDTMTRDYAMASDGPNPPRRPVNGEASDGLAAGLVHLQGKQRCLIVVCCLTPIAEHPHAAQQGPPPSRAHGSPPQRRG